MTTLKNTSGNELLSALAQERRAAGAVSVGLALTLVAVVNDGSVDEATHAATIAAAMHPCRLLVVVRGDLSAADRLDAEVEVGGRLGPGEAVVMRMNGRLALHAESVVLPLVAPDTPVVAWWHGVPPHRIAHDPLGVLADHRVSDCAQAPDPVAALRNRGTDYAPGDIDLAWTRTTAWRGLIAGAFDSPSGSPQRATIWAEQDNASAVLLGGWLKTRLGIRIRHETSEGPGLTGVRLTFDSGDEMRIDRQDGRTAKLSGTGVPDRTLPLPRRELGDLLAEELRRLDPDEPYAAALEACTRSTGLSDREPKRTHVWFDPAKNRGKPEPALSSNLRPIKQAAKKASKKVAAAKKAEQRAAAPKADAKKAAKKTARKAIGRRRTTTGS